MSVFLITKQDVYKIHCRPVGSESGRESYSVEVFKRSDQMLATKLIGFTGPALAVHKMSEGDKLNLAMRLGGRLFAQGSTEDKANVTSDNFPLVLGKEADNEEIDTELMTLIATFFRVQPAERSDLTIHDLFVSSDYRIEDIRRRLLYLANRDWINGVRTDVFRITSKGFEEVESRARGGDTTDVHANKYFQLVSLPRGIKKPFVFVLMPFKDQEGFKQEVYRKVIKPTVEQELGVICVRSDEVPDPGVINNQIFTLIRDAECIIAETTTGNPNVFYEVGMAHAFNKDVFIFNRSKNKLPFDIRGDRAVFYDDYEDLKKKLVENLKDHV